jgi:hypothetical protein
VEDGAAYEVGGFQGEAAADVGGGEGFYGHVAGALHVEVGAGAEDEDAVGVDAVEGSEAFDGSEEAGVFHGGHGEASLAFGPEADPVFGELVHDGAVPVVVGGEGVADEDEGRALGVGESGEFSAEGFDFVVVAEVEVFGLGVGPLDESWVERVEVGAVPGGGVGGGRVGLFGAGGEPAVGPVFGHFAGIDFADDVSDDGGGPGGGADAGDVGVDAGDAVDEDVGVGEVEAGIEAEGHHGGGGVDEGGSADDAEDGVVGVGAEGVLAGREGGAGGEVEGLGEVLALDPELGFAGDVAGVVADFEGGDDDGADGPGSGVGVLLGEGSGEGKGSQEEQAEPRASHGRLRGDLWFGETTVGEAAARRRSMREGCDEAAMPDAGQLGNCLRVRQSVARVLRCACRAAAMTGAVQRDKSAHL